MVCLNILEIKPDSLVGYVHFGARTQRDKCHSSEISASVPTNDHPQGICRVNSEYASRQIML